MAIVRMSKLILAGVAYERGAVLDALQRTGAVQVEPFNPDRLVTERSEAALRGQENGAFLSTGTGGADPENAAESLDFPDEKNKENTAATRDFSAAPDSAEIVQNRARYEGFAAREREVVETLVEAARREDKKKENAKAVPVSRYCDVSYAAFIGIAEHEKELGETVGRVEEITAERAAGEARRTRIDSEIEHLAPYTDLDDPFCEIASTKRVLITVGTVPLETARTLSDAVDAEPLFSERVLSTGTQSQAVIFAAHNAVRADAESLLTRVGFSKCAFDCPVTAAEQTGILERERAASVQNDEELSAQLYALKPKIDEIKILADYHAYLAEKAALEQEFGYTEKSFCLQGFVPTEAIEKVKSEVRGVTDAVYFDFSEPAPDEEVPTLLRNKKAVRPLEFVTNLYSVPSYRERDPNTVMGIFFMIFFGFIMADLGYGLLMTVAGFAIGLKMRKENGARPLILLIATGGVFTMIWGALFGSFFGYGIFPSVLPNPEREPSTLLVYCFAVGVIQIAVGYLVKGVQSQSDGGFFDGLFDGYIWTVFCLGILLALPAVGISLFNANIGFVPPGWLLYAGLGIAGGALVVAMLSAGRKEKGFGKFTKGFGAVYGIVNFLSDVLSYARLFGLMLSGAIVARIVTEMSIGMMTSVGGIIGGVIILLIGHAFNLAMNLLGAYIHDSRLQYIEYFSRFYQGEGTLFTPVGSRFNYITLKR